MNFNWTGMTSVQKTAYIGSFIAMFVFLVGVILRLTHVLNNNYITFPSATFMCACDTVLYWNTKRKLSFVFMGLGTIFLVLFLIQIFAL